MRFFPSHINCFVPGDSSRYCTCPGVKLEQKYALSHLCFGRMITSGTSLLALHVRCDARELGKGRRNWRGRCSEAVLVCVYVQTTSSGMEAVPFRRMRRRTKYGAAASLMGAPIQESISRTDMEDAHSEDV